MLTRLEKLTNTVLENFFQSEQVGAEEKSTSLIVVYQVLHEYTVWLETSCQLALKFDSGQMVRYRQIRESIAENHVVASSQRQFLNSHSCVHEISTDTGLPI